MDGNGAKRCHVDAQCVQILKGLTAEKFPADLMPGCGFAFDQCYASSLAGKRDRSGTTCYSPPRMRTSSCKGF